jgi:uncharacterized protein (DUF2235 family)
MPKNIVICLDGTGNQLKAKGCTNVLKTFELLDLTDPAKQIAYYDPGVGTFSAQGAWTPLGKRLTRLLGLAFGFGLRAKLAEAYEYLMRHSKRATESTSSASAAGIHGAGIGPAW